MSKLNTEDVTPIIDIDTTIHNVLPEYFTSYYQFVLIYTHYEYYSRYSELEIENKIEFPKDLPEAIIRCDEEFQKEDWDSFLDNIKVVRKHDQLNELLSNAIHTLQEIGDEYDDEYDDEQNNDFSDGISDFEN